MKLLFVFKSFNKGGIASVIIQKLNYLAANGFEIHILTEFKNDEKSIAKLNTNIKVHLLPIQNIVSKRRLPIVGFFNLLKEVQKEYQVFIDCLKPDVITGVGFGYNNLILPYLKTSAKKILEIHGSYNSKKVLQPKKSIIDYFITKPENMHNLYDYAITLTQEDLEDRRYLTNQKSFIYNSIDLPAKISEFTERENIIVAVGTLTHNKNFIDLIEAIYLIKNKMENWQVHIYGEGVQKKILQNSINNFGLEKIIYLKGFNYNMNSVYDQAKILVSTSLTEGFGRTMTEALSYKTPIIAYNCKCGPKEIVLDNINGYLIPFDVQSLANALVKLIEDPALLSHFSEHCYDGMDKFEHIKIMTQWVEFYKNIANAH